MAPRTLRRRTAPLAGSRSTTPTGVWRRTLRRDRIASLLLRRDRIAMARCSATSFGSKR
jgi:hypothetical protein